MKAKTMIQVMLCAGSLAVAVAGAQGADVQQLLERGHYLQTARGDLAGAAEVYRSILAVRGGDAEVVMRARFNLATCLLKQGDEAGAKAALQELIDRLPSAESLGAVKEKPGLELQETLSKIVAFFNHLQNFNPCCHHHW